MPEPHEHHLRVRYAETDQMGVAYHANHLVWLEEGRTRMMDSLGLSYAELEREGIGLAVRRVELTYRAPARFDEELVVRTRIDRMRPASICFAYEIVREDDGKLLLEGTVELACIDLSQPGMGLIALPEKVHAALG
ncbi:MAG: thioesterase family protein [Planctomycetota bacterium]|nr:thioesterase family protein [Planctomycetota bacterium]